jgi:hypothetical protein
MYNRDLVRENRLYFAMGYLCVRGNAQLEGTEATGRAGQVA